jgi:hypothetical protein
MCRRWTYLAFFVLVPSVVLTRGVKADLIGWWRLDEGKGTTVADISGRDHHGRFAEGTPEWVDGTSGKALRFDGSNKVEIPDHDDFHLVDAVSVALWAQPESDQPDYAKFFCKQKSGEYPYALQFSSSQTIRATVNASARFDTPSIPNFAGEWAHLCFTYDGTTLILYKDGEEASQIEATGGLQQNDLSLSIGGRLDSGQNFVGIIDDVKLYSHALTLDEILTAMKGEGHPYAFGPEPADGAFVEDTWMTLSWSAGDFAVSHDVYLGDNYDDVSNATIDSDVFWGNQTTTFYVAGFPGYAYPDGLSPGQTYYWRIDEVNETHPESPWKGPVWSFSIVPNTAYHPNPADNAEFVGPEDVVLSWTPGFGAKLHTVYLGDDYDEVSNATGGMLQGTVTYNPGPLELEKVYYWRVDEFDAVETYKGEIWTFTTPGAVGVPQPANGTAGVPMTATLNWTPATNATSHEVYLGLDKETVRNADTGSPEYQGSAALGSESFDPGKLAWDTMYYWRVDAVTNTGTVKGPIWSFTTADFIAVEDFESYTDDDATGEAIWQHWIDGFGMADNGAQVGYFLPPYAEQAIVHGGAQSMPLLYTNEAGVTNSQATMTLTAPRDWTEEGVGELSLWIRGNSANAAEPLYVAISNSTGTPAVSAHDDPTAAQKSSWVQWMIPLQTFADQGITLNNVDKIAIGLGSKSGITTSGGSGMMYIDDLRLYRSVP